MQQYTILRCTFALQTYSVSLKFAKSTIEGYKDSRVDVGITNLVCVLEICKAHHTKIQNIQAISRVDVGVSMLQTLCVYVSLKLVCVSLKFAKSTIQRYKNSRAYFHITSA